MTLLIALFRFVVVVVIVFLFSSSLFLELTLTHLLIFICNDLIPFFSSLEI